MKLTLSQIHDLKDSPDPEEDDQAAEAYHLQIIASQHNDYASFLYQAEKALRNAPPITLDEFVKKWSE